MILILLQRVTTLPICAKNTCCFETIFETPEFVPVLPSPTQSISYRGHV